ncbi:PREDICTED: gamma-interferon-inducible lysosomal thiol reductase [Crocodylus porosus]|uniref:gamma-interferon-inducible lysosomal thiol reductase n=1 Tax=Crocodylus porosus TaxID=8502 RepID=UPI000938B082|nr:PREDICTED: gamma-interferon-inducible lysosomal thiol reductase [Crocodylus porosus]
MVGTGLAGASGPGTRQRTCWTSHYERNVSGRWQFECQHGAEECLGNMMEACLMDVLQDFDVYFLTIFCMESGSSVTGNLGACLQVYAPTVNPSDIMACVKGDQGIKLMHNNAQRTDALQPPHSYVPWIVVNGKHTDALQAQAQSALFNLVCELYTGPKPDACQSSGPGPAALKMVSHCLK